MKVSVGEGVSVGVRVLVRVGVGVPVRVGVNVGKRVGITTAGVSVRRGDQVEVSVGWRGVIVGAVRRFTETKKYPNP